MKKITLLMLLSITSLGTVLAVTPDESKTMADGYIYYQRNEWQKCVDTFQPLLQQNPALKDEMAKPAVSNDRAGAVLAECQARLERSKVTNTPEYQAAYGSIHDAMYAGMYFKGEGPIDEQYTRLKKCIDGITNAIKQYPEFANYNTDDNGPIATDVLADCQKKFVPVKAAYDKQVQQATNEQAARFATVNSQYQAGIKAFQDAVARPEKTNTDILLKYRDLTIAIDKLSNATSAFAPGDMNEQNPDPKLMVGKLTLPQFVQQRRDAINKAYAALRQIQPKVDKAFDQQDAQVKANLPKLVSGDKLAIYKRFGIPKNWAGGDPRTSKYGIYSGDGVAVAKDIATSTMWYYGDSKGNGCTYNFYFTKNTMTRVDKPLGC